MEKIYATTDIVTARRVCDVLNSNGYDAILRNLDRGTSTPTGYLRDIEVCIRDGGNYDKALALVESEIRELERDAVQATTELVCPSCKEKNPGTFSVCWNCGGSI